MMAALSKAFSQTIGLKTPDEDLSAILIFCGAGLLLSLVLTMIFGVDLVGALL